MSNLKMPDISEQVSMQGLASRAKEARDNKTFVKSLFTEIETLKNDNIILKEMIQLVLDKLEDQKKVKVKAEKAE